MMIKVGDRVKIISKKRLFHLRASQHSGDEGVVIEIRWDMTPTYYLVSFGQNDNAAYLLSEIEIVRQ